MSIRTAHPAAGRLSVAEKIGYGLGDAGAGVFTGLMATFLTYFYTDIYDLSAAFVGTLFLIVRVIDAVSDPLMGVIADRTRSRWGRYRPWQLWGAFPIAAVGVAIFVTPAWGTGAKLAYAAAGYVLFSLSYTLVNVPYCAMCSAMTRDDREIMSAQSYRFAAAALVSLTVVGGFPLLAAWFTERAGGDARSGYPLAAAVYAVAGATMILICFLSVRERVAPPAHPPSAMRRQVRLALGNDQLRLAMAMIFLLIAIMIVRNGSAMYLLQRVMHASTGYTSAMLGMGGLLAIAGAVLAGTLARRVPVERLFLRANLVLAVVSALSAIIPPTQQALWFVAWALMTGGASFLLPLMFSLVTYCDDYGEWTLGERSSGVNFGFALFAIKLSWAAGGAVIGFLLWAAAYDPRVAVQPAAAQSAIVSLVTLVPAALHLAMWALGRRYRLDADMRARIAGELVGVRSAAAADLTAAAAAAAAAA